MTTHAMLQQPAVDALPGEATTGTLSVRNTGDIVDNFRLIVVGEPAAWITVEPAEISLYPGAEESATLTYTPPRSSQVPAGERAYAVRVVPQERPAGEVAVEGRVTVAPFTETTADLMPRTSTGRRKGRHEVSVDNRGNVPIAVQLSVADEDGKLDFDARPPAHQVPPGQAVFTKLSVRARKRLWRGQPLTHPFSGAVHSLDPTSGEECFAPVPLDGALVQRPLIPKNALKWLAALLALLLLLVAAWFLLLKPAVESAAKNAVETPMEELAEKVDEAEEKAKAAEEKADAAEEAIEEEGGQVKPAEPTVTETSVKLRLETTVADNGTGNATHTVPADTVLAITDLFLENPQGDAGKLEILVDGKVLRTFSLANFRDLDFHYVTPVEVPAGKQVRMNVTCATPGDQLSGVAADRCFTGVVLSGVNITEVEDE